LLDRWIRLLQQIGQATLFGIGQCVSGYPTSAPACDDGSYGRASNEQ